MSTGEPCARCEHPMDDHCMYSLTENPMNGGIVLCPSLGCRCLGTWGIGGRPVPKLPPQETIEELRQQIQSGVEP